MNDTDRGQVGATAAEVYDRFFVPALFSQWTDVVLAAGDVQPGDRVLDVGCGTGVLARAARARVGRSGTVTGVDPNDGMLTIARGADPGVDWQDAVAEELPFPDHSFDRTVSQFALMFFADRKRALHEMRRLTTPQGRIALAVWDGLESNAGYFRLTKLLEELFGAQHAAALRAPFELGDAQALARLAAVAVDSPVVTTHRGVARFSSLEAWLHTEIRGWTLADLIDDDDFDRLLAAARSDLADLVVRDGVAFEVSALVVSGRPAR